MTPDSLDAWLSRAQVDLDELLDIEAGLREILLQSGHDERVDALEPILDEEAGLADILEPADNPLRTPPSRADHKALESYFFCTDDALHAMTPTERMRLRSTPSVSERVEYVELLREVYYGLSLAQAGTARQMGAQVLVQLPPVITKSMSFLERHGIDNEALSQADACLANIKMFQAATPSVTASPVFGRAAIGAMRCALDLTETAIEYTASNTRQQLIESRLFFAAVHLLDGVRRARNLLVHHDGASMPTADLEAQLGSVITQAQELLATCVATVHTEIEKHLGRTIQPLAESSLRLMLDDFTTADLSDADFKDVDMTGMRWSEHGTQWPATVSTETLKAVSEEEPNSSGIYVIRFGASANFFDLAHIL